MFGLSFCIINFSNKQLPLRRRSLQVQDSRENETMKEQHGEGGQQGKSLCENGNGSNQHHHHHEEVSQQKSLVVASLEQDRPLVASGHQQLIMMNEIALLGSNKPCLCFDHQHRATLNSNLKPHGDEAEVENSGHDREDENHEPESQVASGAQSSDSYNPNERSSQSEAAKQQQPAMTTNFITNDKPKSNHSHSHAPESGSECRGQDATTSCVRHGNSSSKLRQLFLFDRNNSSSHSNKEAPSTLVAGSGNQNNKATNQTSAKSQQRKSSWLRSKFSLSSSNLAPKASSATSSATTTTMINEQEITASSTTAVVGSSPCRAADQQLEQADQNRGLLIRPKSALSATSADLIAAQKSLAAAAAAKVKRDRLTRIDGTQAIETRGTKGQFNLHQLAAAAAPLSQNEPKYNNILSVKTNTTSNELSSNPNSNNSSTSSNLSNTIHHHQQHGALSKFMCTHRSAQLPPNSSSGLISKLSGGEVSMQQQQTKSGRPHHDTNSVGMTSESSPSNNGAESDNSLQTSSQLSAPIHAIHSGEQLESLDHHLHHQHHHDLNAANSDAHQTPSPLGILSRILLNNKSLLQRPHHPDLADHGEQAMIQVQHQVPSSSSSNSPPSLAGSSSPGKPSTHNHVNGPLMLASRSRQPIVERHQQQQLGHQTSDPFVVSATNKGPAPRLPPKALLKGQPTRHHQLIMTHQRTSSFEPSILVERLEPASGLPSERQHQLQANSNDQARFPLSNNLCDFHHQHHNTTTRLRSYVPPMVHPLYHHQSPYPMVHQHHHQQHAYLSNASDLSQHSDQIQYGDSGRLGGQMDNHTNTQHHPTSNNYHQYLPYEPIDTNMQQPFLANYNYHTNSQMYQHEQARRITSYNPIYSHDDSIYIPATTGGSSNGPALGHRLQVMQPTTHNMDNRIRPKSSLEHRFSTEGADSFNKFQLEMDHHNRMPAAIQRFQQQESLRFPASIGGPLNEVANRNTSSDQSTAVGSPSSESNGLTVLPNDSVVVVANQQEDQSTNGVDALNNASGRPHSSACLLVQMSNGNKNNHSADDQKSGSSGQFETTSSNSIVGKLNGAKKPEEDEQKHEGESVGTDNPIGQKENERLRLDQRSKLNNNQNGDDDSHLNKKNKLHNNNNNNNKLKAQIHKTAPATPTNNNCCYKSLVQVNQSLDRSDSETQTKAPKRLDGMKSNCISQVSSGSSSGGKTRLVIGNRASPIAANQVKTLHPGDHSNNRLSMVTPDDDKNVTTNDEVDKTRDTDKLLISKRTYRPISLLADLDNCCDTSTVL